MKPYIEKALAIELDPKQSDTFRAFMADYYEGNILEILAEYGTNDKILSTVRAEIWQALAPKDRMVFGIMELIGAIMWGGLMGALATSDSQRIQRFQEAIGVSGSEFLKERFDEALRLFETKRLFGIIRRPTQDAGTIAKIEAIGEDIDNWEYEDVEKMYYQLASQK